MAKHDQTDRFAQVFIIKELMAMYQAMHTHFGHRKWWPGDTPLEICIGAILTQNTNWANVEKALANLKQADALCLPTLRDMDHETLAGLIRPAGYFNVKARRLKHFIQDIFDTADGDLQAYLARPLEVLRPALLAVNGIGPETADSIILYAAQQPTFVVDAYTGRIFRRHGLLASDQHNYHAIKALFEEHLPRDINLWNDYHAQIVEVGKHFCKPTAKCDGCPLAKFPHDAKRK